jgi:hypothetical protein
MLGTRAIVLGFVAVLTIGSARGESQKPPTQSSESTQQQAAPEQRGTASAPFVIQILPLEQTQKDAKPAANQGHKKRFVSWSLSDEIAGIASVAAFLQFLALIITVWIMIRNGRRQLRAYVWVKAVVIRDIGLTKQAWVKLELRNAGQTPAYDLMIAGACFVRPHPLPRGIPFPVINWNDVAPMVLHPGAEPPFNAEISVQFPLTPEELAGVMVGTQMRLCAYIVLNYRDAFRIKRETRACISVLMGTQNLVTGEIPLTFAAVGEHNTAT